MPENPENIEQVVYSESGRIVDILHRGHKKNQRISDATKILFESENQSGLVRNLLKILNHVTTFRSLSARNLDFYKLVIKIVAKVDALAYPEAEEILANMYDQLPEDLQNLVLTKFPSLYGKVPSLKTDTPSEPQKKEVEKGPDSIDELVADIRRRAGKNRYRL